MWVKHRKLKSLVEGAKIVLVYLKWPCRTNFSTHLGPTIADNTAGSMRSYQKIKSGDEEDLQLAVALEGPIAFAADVQHNTFRVGCLCVCLLLPSGCFSACLYPSLWLCDLVSCNIVAFSFTSMVCMTSQTAPPTSWRMPCSLLAMESTTGKIFGWSKTGTCGS